MTLGTYPRFGVADARKGAKAALLDTAKGMDPAAAKVEAKRASATKADADCDLFRNVAVGFVERHAKRRNRPWQDTEKLLQARR